MAGKKDDKKKPDKKDKGAGKPKKSGGKRKLLMLMLVAAGIAVPAAGMVALAGLVPTLVMAMTDRSRAKSLTVCVGTLNAAGVLHALITLGQKGGFTLENASWILHQPQSFIIMWGAAAIGYGLYSFIPPIVSQLLVSMAEGKITRLRFNQKELKRIWGDQVGGGL